MDEAAGVDGPGGAGARVADVDGAGGVEKEGTSTGLVLAFLAPLKLTVRSPKFQQFFLM